MELDGVWPNSLDLTNIVNQHYSMKSAVPNWIIIGVNKPE